MLHKTNKKSYIYFTLIVSTKIQQKAHTIVLSGENLFFFFSHLAR